MMTESFIPTLKTMCLQCIHQHIVAKLKVLNQASTFGIKDCGLVHVKPSNIVRTTGSALDYWEAQNPFNLHSEVRIPPCTRIKSIEGQKPFSCLVGGMRPGHMSGRLETSCGTSWKYRVEVCHCVKPTLFACDHKS